MAYFQSVIFAVIVVVVFIFVVVAVGRDAVTTISNAFGRNLAGLGGSWAAPGRSGTLAVSLWGFPPSYVPSHGPAHTASLRPQFTFVASKCYFSAFRKSSYFSLPIFLAKI